MGRPPFFAAAAISVLSLGLSSCHSASNKLSTPISIRRSSTRQLSPVTISIGMQTESGAIPQKYSPLNRGRFLLRSDPDNHLRLRMILDSLSGGNNPAGSIEQKVGDMYASGMDSTTIEKRGIDPLKPYLQAIDSIRDVRGAHGVYSCCATPERRYPV